MTKPKSNLMEREPWSDFVMGNDAVARAMVESGVRVATTYPGSPTPEIAAALDAVKAEERNYYFEYSVNEKVALEVAVGASLNGHFSTVFFKSVGLNVAADSLIQTPLFEMIGGMVVVIGDDPGVNSSQNEQDNRHFARMSYIPMLEPATPTEAYKMFLEAARLSKKHRAPVFLRLTTHVCHAKEWIDFQHIPDFEPNWESRFDKANGPYLPLVDWVFPLKKRALEKLESFAIESDQSVFNRILHNRGPGKTGARRLGIISAGLPALSLFENLDEADINIDLMQVGMTFPLPHQMISAFIQAHDEVLVVEELDRILETELKALAWDVNSTCKLHFRFGIDELLGELTPDRTWTILSRCWPDLFGLREEWRAPIEKAPVPRYAQMCPGCGHRSAFFAIAKAMAVDTIPVADIGCHTMGIFPPHEIGDVLLSMGHSTSTGSGLAIRNRRKVISFLGDSTLFHAGLPGILNAVVHNHPVTLFILENGTTAMTGHQPRPGSGEIGEKISIPVLLKTLGVQFIREVDAYNQTKLTQVAKEAMEYDGFAVVIAAHPCMLKFVRTQRARVPEFKTTPVRIDQEICDHSRVCIESFGCPSFAVTDEGDVVVDPKMCIGDGSCRSTCPVGAIARTSRGGDQ